MLSGLYDVTGVRLGCESATMRHKMTSILVIIRVLVNKYKQIHDILYLQLVTIDHFSTLSLNPNMILLFTVLY